jgi:hypothetical protein
MSVAFGRTVARVREPALWNWKTACLTHLEHALLFLPCHNPDFGTLMSVADCIGMFQNLLHQLDPRAK